MRKLPLSIALLTSVFFLAGCSTASSLNNEGSSQSNTQVRLLSLRNASQQPRANKSSIRSLDNRIGVNENNSGFIFVGDTVSFTIELEDPNFEFISLLALKFNGQVIRANTNDSIVSTRDCGANICVDFPFRIVANITEYTVEEVKFAKLNADAGVNAIIDNQSQNTITLDIYNDPVFPYVKTGVEKLNEMVSTVAYAQSNPTSINIDEWNTFVDRRTNGRLMVVVDVPMNNTSYFTTNGLGESRNTPVPVGESDNITQNFIINNHPQVNGGGAQNFTIYASNHSTETSNGEFRVIWIEYLLYEQKYSSTNFYNNGNDIYVNIMGEDFFIFTMTNQMKILTLQESGFRVY